MAIKKTTDEWIQNARLVWGDLYDYSQSEYVNSKQHVIVICQKHGSWKCQAGNHLKKNNPRGCPDCGRERQVQKAIKPLGSFIQEAVVIHGDKYDYSQSTYLGAKEYIDIACPKHGIFQQTPDSHINGKSGCPICASEHATERDLLSEVEVASRIFKASKGTVSVVTGSYKGMNSKCIFECSEHGVFERFTNSAMKGIHPCTKCSGGKKFAYGYTTREFEEKIHELISNEITFKPFEYQGKYTRITFICPEHGEFIKSAEDIQRRPNCPRCAYIDSSSVRIDAIKKKNTETLRVRFDRWVEAASDYHNGRYDYSNSEYISARDDIEIICPIHGSFLQKPDSHLSSGCRKCADDNLQGRYTEKYFERFPERKNYSARLYYIKFSYKKQNFYKVGITTTSILERFSLLSKAGVTLDVLGALETTLYNAFRLEFLIQREHGDKFRYRPKFKHFTARELRIGPTECFKKPLSKQRMESVFGEDI
jgi:hypothetical protein